MSRKEDEVSEQSGECVCSQHMMSGTMSAGGNVVEAQRTKTACAWRQREQAMERARENISAGVVAQGVERDGTDFLWRVLGVVEGGQDSQEEERTMEVRQGK